jgi:hypothetical protein
MSLGRRVGSILGGASIAVVALAGTAIPAHAAPSSAASSWTLFGVYQTESECNLVGTSLTGQGLREQYLCKRVGPLIMPKYQLWVA